MKDWFTMLFDKEKEEAWQSTVITDWKYCYKLYDWLGFEWIKIYSESQSMLAQRIYEIDFPNWLSIWEWMEVKKVKAKFLDIKSDIIAGSDILTKRHVGITKVPFIDWETLSSYITKKHIPSYKFSPLLDKLDEIVENTILLNMKLNVFNTITQLSTHNIKIEYINWEEMWIIVTDICVDIPEFLLKNRWKVGLILSAT